jgi:hypothetical protein
VSSRSEEKSDPGKKAGAKKNYHIDIGFQIDVMGIIYY